MKLVSIKFCLLVLLMVLIGMVTVSAESIGTYKQGSTITLVQICDTCTYNNITSIVRNSVGISTVIPLNVAMTKSGTFYNYSFNQTSLVGVYEVHGVGDLDGSVEVWGYTFEVTPSGFTGTLGFYSLIFLIATMILVLGFWIRDAWVTILGSFVLVCVGLFVIIYGVVGIKDTAYTWAIGIIVMLLASYIGVKSAMETMNS